MRISTSVIFVVLVLATSQLLEGQAQADPAAAKNALFHEFEEQKNASPPLAYLSARRYLRRYGVDVRGLQVKKWAEAYEATAPGIYSAHDREFGLYSQNLNLLLHSASWANRGARSIWAMAPTFDSFAAVFERGGQAASWAQGIPDDVRWVPSSSENLAFWKNGDWQSFDANGSPMNPSSKRQDLVQAIHRLSDGTGPSGLFANSDGGWIVTWGKNQFQCSTDIPQDLCAHLSDIRSKNQMIRQISFGDNGAWLILYGRNGAYWHDVPTALSDTWKSLVQQNKNIESASILSGGGWYVKVSK